MSLSMVLCDSLEKVFPDQAPRPLNTSIPLVGHAGERTGFQIALHASRGEQYRTLTRPQIRITTPEGVTATLSQVELVPVSLPRHPWLETPEYEYLRDADGFRGPGLFPDLLRPLDPDQPPEVVFEQWTSVWVSLEVDAGTASADRAVVVEVTEDDGSAAGGGDDAIGPESFRAEIPLLTVGGRLPELGIVNTHWFHCDGLVQFYDLEPFTERYWDVIGNFLRAAARMSVNSVLTPVWTPPVDTAVGSTRLPSQLLGITDAGGGTYTFDTSRLERWLQIAREVGIHHLELPHLFTQWGARATPAIYVDTPTGTEQRFGWHVPATDPSYRALLEQMIPFLRDFLDEHWSGSVLFHVSDEPGEEHLEDYLAAREVVLDLLDGATVVDALSSFAFYERGLVPVPVASTNHAQPFLDARVDPLWVYYCVSQNQGVSNRFIAQPSARNRALGTQLFAAGVQGFLHWGFNFYNNQYSTRPVNPFVDTSAGGVFPGGDPFIVYPGADGDAQLSIRFEVFEEAMVDHRVGQALEAALGREQALEVLGVRADDGFALGDVTADELRERSARAARELVGGEAG